MISLPEQAPEPPGWIEVVANYQKLYTAETVAAPLAPPIDSATRAQAETEKLRALSDVIGLDLVQLHNIDGLKFRRAQQLGFRGKPLIQIAYALPDGTPVALCILPSTAAAKDVRAQMVQGMASTDWNTGAHGILLIGSDDQELINTLTPKVQSLI